MASRLPASRLGLSVQARVLRPARCACAGMLALTLLLCAVPARAFAETEDISAEANGLQAAVESTAAKYDEATERVAEIKQQIEDNQVQIQELDEQIPVYREACNDSMVGVYKLQRGGMGVLAVILGSQDFSSFLTTYDQFNRIFDTANERLRTLARSVQERKDAQAALEEAQADAEDVQADAERAMLLAVAQREAAQKAAEEQAQLEAREREAAEQAAQEKGEEAPEAPSASAPSVGDADWSGSKASFVSSWAGRLDGYLAGSPLSGQGKTFAAAAWDAGIDPRFSAAISEVESSRGAACFRPYNAWGWGSVSWGSWEEAIPAHAMGLARGYGYTVSEAAAQKYCPGNWQHWYDRVAQEMAKI